RVVTDAKGSNIDETENRTRRRADAEPLAACLAAWLGPKIACTGTSAAAELKTDVAQGATRPPARRSDVPILRGSAAPRENSMLRTGGESRAVRCGPGSG